MSKNICFRLANQRDIDDVATIYQRLHETLSQTINYPRWPIGIYPIKEDAIDAVNKNELYVLVDEHIIGSVILNQTQEDGYQNAH